MAISCMHLYSGAHEVLWIERITVSPNDMVMTMVIHCKIKCLQGILALLIISNWNYAPVFTHSR